MKQGMDLVNLAQELQRQAESKRDYLVNASAISVDTQEGKTQLVLGQQEEPVKSDVTPHAHTQLSEYLDIPKKYYDRIRTQFPAVYDFSVNSLLGSRDEVRMVRTLDGKARAILSDRYRRIDNFNTAQVVLSELPKLPFPVHFSSLDLTETKLYIKITTDRFTAEVKKGDPVRMGLQFTNSEIGLSSFRIEPFIERLICTNGMVTQDFSLKRYHVGKQVTGSNADMLEAEEIFADDTLLADDNAFLLKVRDLIRASFTDDIFQKIVGSFREAAERKLQGSVEGGVRVLGNRLGLGLGEQQDVLRHLIAGGDISQWGLANAVTRTAADVESYDRASQLEAIGGKVITLGPDEWKAIATASTDVLKAKAA